jgi:class 3 adenylate cyclase
MPVKKSNKELHSLILKGNQLKREQEAAIKKIRAGFKDVVVMFIDMANSTKMKTGKLKNEPETWIKNIFEFGNLVSKRLKKCNGQAVKYIGDEVMAVFTGKNKIYDASTFVEQLEDIENEISNATGYTIKIKISLDFGKVYNLKYPGNKEFDPQGTPVDRCARIAKLCSPSTILTSAAFLKQVDSKQEWHSVGKTKLKGLGDVEIFQYKSKTVELERKQKVYYYIVNKASGKVLDLKQSSNEDNAEIILYPCQKTDNQVWEFAKEKNNVYSIRNKYSGKCLEVKNASKLNAAQLQQNHFTGALEQLWSIVSNNDCTFCITPNHVNGKFLEQDAETVKNEIGKLIQHDWFKHDTYDRNHQKWFLVPTDFPLLG